MPASITTPDRADTELLGTLSFRDGMPSAETAEKALDFLTISRGVESARRDFSIYPLALAGKAPPVRVVDATGVQFNTIFSNDFSYPEELNRVVQNEPPELFDPQLYGTFAAIGIRKGQPFEPDARTRKLLTDAVAIGNAYARAITFAPRASEQLRVWPDRQYLEWKWTWDFMVDGALSLDDRTRWYYSVTGHSEAKMLARVELQNDRDGAVALQRQIRITPLGEPKFPPAVKIPSFDHARLVGVELFDAAEDLLKSAPDVSPIAAQLQARVRAVALAAKDPAQRAAIDKLIRDQVIPRFNRFATQEAGPVRNNWLGTMVIGNYGEDFWIRSSANLIGIWANNTHEVIYFVTTRDAAGRPLDGSNTYELHFPKDALPQDAVKAFWSIHLVGVPDFMPVPNPLDRFVLSTYSNVRKNPDGSLTLVLAPEPVPGVPQANWLPTAPGKPFSLTWRTYIPKEMVRQGNWFPPVVSTRN